MRSKQRKVPSPLELARYRWIIEREERTWSEEDQLWLEEFRKLYLRKPHVKA